MAQQINAKAMHAIMWIREYSSENLDETSFDRDHTESELHEAEFG
ncbi:hypothetical protein BH23CYA1_BH23CYA1_17010 [soil metagenome]